MYGVCVVYILKSIKEKRFFGSLNSYTMKNFILLFFAGFFIISFQSCADKIDTKEYHYTDDEYAILSKTLNLPTKTYQYPVATNFQVIPNENGNDPVYHKATLGRVLFYDKMLSADGSTSCASCHHQENAFADPRAVSQGIDGKEGTRNALPLGNTIGFVRYYGTDLASQFGNFAWDESKESIAKQSEAAITNPVEMAHDMYALVDEIKNQDYYQVLFKKAYGENQITKANILDALQEFVNTMTAGNSKFDKGLKTRFSADLNFDNFTASENRGKQVYNQYCSACHGRLHNAIVNSYDNNGLDLVYEDKGVGGWSHKASEMGTFKVPSLRNIELTAPYMHDGRFSTLEEVVEHYSTGIKSHQNLSYLLPVGGFKFSDQQKIDLVNYLKTLTDNEFVQNVKFSDPFK